MRTVNHGETIPLGLSKWKDILSTGWQIRLPLFVWHGSHYDILTDRHRVGWASFMVLLKYRSQELAIRWGWSFIKQTNQEASQCTR